MAHPQVTDAGTASNMEGSCILGKPTTVGPPGWGLGEVLTTLQRKKITITKHSQLLGAWTDYLIKGMGVGEWTGLILLRFRTGGGLLRHR